MPASNVEYWADKFHRNRMRDRLVRRQLEARGWQVLVIWECELREPSKVRQRLKDFIGPQPSHARLMFRGSGNHSSRVKLLASS